ncbi:MAG: NAD(P)H-binding protein, partial [bacterium]|nr:NAD(P)H-binding protein [bacterium]
MKKIYIITGANGFLGNNIIRKLELETDTEIRAFVLNGDSIKSLQNLRCKIYYGDVTNKDSLSSVFENTDGKEVFVIHCAGVVY